jgi:hypothetical protein
MTTVSCFEIVETFSIISECILGILHKDNCTLPIAKSKRIFTWLQYKAGQSFQLRIYYPREHAMLHGYTSCFVVAVAFVVGCLLVLYSISSLRTCRCSRAATHAVWFSATALHYSAYSCMHQATALHYGDCRALVCSLRTCRCSRAVGAHTCSLTTCHCTATEQQLCSGARITRIRPCYLDCIAAAEIVGSLV